jgi:hypothetical protein
MTIRATVGILIGLILGVTLGHAQFSPLALGATGIGAAVPGSPGGGGGTNYYFSQSTGSDSNAPCTSSSAPCQTIAELNSLTYASGSTINLKAGDTWSAGTTLTLCGAVGNPPSGVTTPCTGTPNVSGSLTVTTYGGGTCNPIAGTTSGCATLQASGSQTVGVYALGMSNLTIQNLSVLGNTSATLPADACGSGHVGSPSFNSIAQCSVGIYYTNNNSTTSNITITNNEANGYDADIMVNSWYPVTLSSNVTVSGNYAHGSSVSSADQIGILVGGVQNSAVQGNMAANIGSVSSNWALGGPTGILFAVTLNSTDQFNVAHDIGRNGPQGAANWQYVTSGLMMQFNESYNQLAGNSYDGEGFDFDCGVNSSIGQYNYSHNNWGPGFYFYAAGGSGANSGWCTDQPAYPLTYPWGGSIVWANNQFRYNVSAGDMYGWTGGSRASFSLEVGTQTGTNGWYNNTIYTHATANSTTNGQCFGNTANNMSNMLVYNNICYNDNGNPYVNTTAAIAGLDYNDYYRTGTTPSPQWAQNGTNYSTLASWQGSGNDAHGLNVNPNFSGTPANTTCYSSSVPTGHFSCPTWVQLSSGSSMIGAGANLSGSFTLPSLDYFGNSIPNGVGSGYNIGADGGNQ